MLDWVEGAEGDFGFEYCVVGNVEGVVYRVVVNFDI